tara:strand:- start:587 stop:1861 length:1275 start_codon:yes stop_codon:yes gene_type:complete
MYTTNQMCDASGSNLMMNPMMNQMMMQQQQILQMMQQQSQMQEMQMKMMTMMNNEDEESTKEQRKDKSKKKKQKRGAAQQPPQRSGDTTVNQLVDQAQNLRAAEQQIDPDEPFQPLYMEEWSEKNEYELLKISNRYLAVKNNALAFECLEFTAKKYKNPLAHYYLGICYRRGIGVLKDKRLARKWFEKASGQELAEAQCAVAIIDFYEGSYIHSPGICNYDNVSSLLRKAIQQNYEPAIIIMDTINRVGPNPHQLSAPPQRLEETMNFVNDSQLLQSLAKHRATIYEPEQSQIKMNKKRRLTKAYARSIYTPDLNTDHQKYIDALHIELYTRKIKLKIDNGKTYACKADIEGFVEELFMVRLVKKNASRYGDKIRSYITSTKKYPEDKSHFENLQAFEEHQRSLVAEREQNNGSTQLYRGLGVI